MIRRYQSRTMTTSSSVENDTIFALASGQGRAGVAVVRISGPLSIDAYVIFYRISHSHLFNKLEIHTTFMYLQPLFLVTHSLAHKLTQAIMHAYVTLEPQVIGDDGG